ncbi:chaplin, partial [Streptomyces phaeofaciens]
MRQTLSKGMVAAAAATSILSLCAGGTAFADSHAGGAPKSSPGVLSGKNVQDPADVPVKACGNPAAAAALGPAAGNSCADSPAASRKDRTPAARDHDDDPGRGGSKHEDSDSGYGDSDAGYGYGDEHDHSTPPSYDDDDHSTPPPYGGGHSTPPSY